MPFDEAQKPGLVAGAKLSKDFGIAARRFNGRRVVSSALLCHTGAFQDGRNDSCGPSGPRRVGGK